VVPLFEVPCSDAPDILVRINMRQVISSFIFVFDFAKIPMMSIIVSAAGSSMVRISFEGSLFTSVESPFVLGSCALGSLTAEGFAERTWTLDSCLSTSDLVRVEVKLKVGGPGEAGNNDPTPAGASLGKNPTCRLRRSTGESAGQVPVKSKEASTEVLSWLLVACLTSTLGKDDKSKSLCEYTDCVFGRRSSSIHCGCGCGCKALSDVSMAVELVLLKSSPVISLSSNIHVCRNSSPSNEAGVLLFGD